MKCAKCRDAYYCNAYCQKVDRLGHKERCEILKDAAEKRAAVSTVTVEESAANLT